MSLTRKDATKKLLEQVGVDASQIKDALRLHNNKDTLVKELWNIIPYFYDPSKIWWIWEPKNHKWVMSDETDVMLLVKDNSHVNTINSRERNEILEAMRQYGRRRKPEDIKPTWIQFKDVIYDIATGDEFKASPAFFVRNPIPWSLNEKITSTPVLDAIFASWVGEDYVRTLYEIIAYALLPSYPIHRMFFLVGSGMNGKSKFLEILTKFLGEENTTSTELDQLMTSRFEVSRLYGKLACIMGETNFSEMSKTSILKKLTGGDLIGFEFKHKAPFEDRNYAKIIVATNTLPSTLDTSIGFYRRMSIIDFPNQFTEKKDILATIPDEEYNALAAKSVLLLAELLQKREFHKEGTIDQRMQRFEERSNPFTKFMSQYIQEKPMDEYITVAEFHKKLNDWLRANRFKSYSHPEINKKMKELSYFQDYKTLEWWEGSYKKTVNARVWLGIGWKNG